MRICDQIIQGKIAIMKYAMQAKESICAKTVWQNKIIATANPDFDTVKIKGIKVLLQVSLPWKPIESKQKW